MKTRYPIIIFIYILPSTTSTLTKTCQGLPVLEALVATSPVLAYTSLQGFHLPCGAVMQPEDQV